MGGDYRKEEGEMQRKRVDAAMLRDFIEEHFASYLDFSKRLGISYSHLYYILERRTEITEKTARKFESVFREYGVEFEAYLMPLPLELAGAKYAQIDVLDAEENLLCSISSQDIVHADGVRVVCRPYDS